MYFQFGRVNTTIYTQTYTGRLAIHVPLVTEVVEIVYYCVVERGRTAFDNKLKTLATIANMLT